MGAFKDKFRESVMAKLEAEAHRVAAEMAQDARTLLSVQVEHQGGKIVRSVRGESPRREYGILQESQADEVSRTAPNTVSITLSNSAPYARRLHYSLDRPWLTILMNHWAPLMRGRMAAAIRSRENAG